MDEYHDPTRTEFRGLPVYLAGSAYRVLISKGMSLYDVVTILEEGEDCAQSRRKANTIERCATYRKEWVKVVAVQRFHQKFGEDCWLVIHLDEAEKQ